MMSNILESMEIRDLDEIDNQVFLLCKMLKHTNVVEISNAIKSPLEQTIEIIRILHNKELVSLDKFGNVNYISQRSIPFVISSETLPMYESQILNFTRIFTPEKFPQQRRLAENFIIGISRELDLIKDIMKNEKKMIVRWEPEGPVKDIELSYNQGQKVLHIQVKSSKNKIAIKISELEKIIKQYGKKGFVAIKLNDLPFYIVSAEELRKKGILNVDPDALLRELSTHYNVKLFKQGIRNCSIP